MNEILMNGIEFFNNLSIKTLEIEEKKFKD